MRDSRRLAFILAALVGSVPFTAFAQTTGAQQGRAGAAPSDDDEDDDEAEAPAATPAARSNSSEAAETPETDEARRTRYLTRHSSLDGSVGLLRTTSGQLGGAGSFRFGLIGEYFGASEFLRPGSLSGTSAVGGTDEASHVGGLHRHIERRLRALNPHHAQPRWPRA